MSIADRIASLLGAAKAKPKRVPRPREDAPRPSARLAHEIVGESHYQDALAEICGGKTEAGHLKPCRAVLIPEPNNPHDPNAVVVTIEGKTVGYLPRQSAKRFAKAFGSSTQTCDAKIVGGWRRREGRSWDEGHFGVELDLRA